MLQIKNINVSIKDTLHKDVLKDFSLTINDGEIHALMGPNGTGKSTLSKAIMGHFKYNLEKGDIIFNKQSLKDLTTDERARLGIFLAMQDPTEIEGVNNSEFLRVALNEKNKEKVNLYQFIKDLEQTYQELSLDQSFIHRSINKGFSGGEKKKNEIAQIKILKPKLIILDEIDSGLDVDSLKIVCENLVNYIKENKYTSILIITHYPRIFKYLKPDYVHILKDGNIKETGTVDLALKIEKEGYNSINAIRKSIKDE